MDKDWLQFHDLYDTWPALQARLALVQAQISAVLTAAPAGPVRVLSLCAGDGRDLAGVLSTHLRRDDVSARLIERSAPLVARGQAAYAQQRFASTVQFVCADAALADTYLSLAPVFSLPADLVVLAGVLGNLSKESVSSLVDSLPGLCRAGGAVIWTHQTRDLAGEYKMAWICHLFREAGFSEQALARTHPSGFAVATYLAGAKEQALTAGAKLFTF